MNTDKQSVAVELYMCMDDSDDREETTTKATGLFYKMADKGVLTYTENPNSNDAIHNLITIQSGKVSIKRSGAVEMHQHFLPGQETESLFQHAYGAIHMLVNTETIDIRMGDTEGNQLVTIDYTAVLNSQHTRKHHLVLKINAK